MQFIDTHIHLQDYKSRNTPQIIQTSGIDKFVCVAAQEADWDNVLALAAQWPGRVVPAVGLHPWYVAEAKPGWAQRLKTKLQQYPQALLGECGLDKARNPDLAAQQEVFAAQIELAQELRRPLLVHAVKAQQWLEDFWPRLAQCRFVLHSFSGSVELLRRALSFGAYLSFAPSAVGRKFFPEVAGLVPAERILLESDGPYQGEPEDIRGTLAALAELRCLQPEVLAVQIYQNSEEFIHV